LNAGGFHYTEFIGVVGLGFNLTGSAGVVGLGRLLRLYEVQIVPLDV